MEAIRLPRCTTGTVTSLDGTSIGYRQSGQGPGLILLHGAMQSAGNFTQIAAALSDAFTVFVPDRRGRGLSGPSGEHHGMQAEIEDVAALMAQTQTSRVFGLSSGALIALHAARSLPALRQIALYEPPLDLGSLPSPQHWVARYEQELSRGDLAAAMVTVMKGTDPSPFTSLPRALLVPLIRLGMRLGAGKGEGGRVSLRVLVPSVLIDTRLIAEAAGSLETFRAVSAEVLLLGGSQSVSYLATALHALQGMLPHARRVELSGVGHLAPDNGGQPERVAAELRCFFSQAS